MFNFKLIRGNLPTLGSIVLCTQCTETTRKPEQHTICNFTPLLLLNFAMSSSTLMMSNMRESKQANKYGHPTQPLYARLSKLFVLRESVLLRARVYHTTSPTA
jgi:hypothetical protein